MVLCRLASSPEHLVNGLAQPTVISVFSVSLALESDLLETTDTLFFFLKDLFVFLIMYECHCLWWRKRPLGPLELELQAVVAA